MPVIVTGEQLKSAIAERRSHFSDLPAVDFIRVFTQELETALVATFPCFNGVTRQGSWFNDETIDLNYCRPNVGRGQDISWRIVISHEGIHLQLTSGDFSRQLAGYLDEIIHSKLHLLISTCISASLHFNGLKVMLNNYVLPFNDLMKSLQENPVLQFQGDVVSFVAEIKELFCENHMTDVIGWICRAVDALEPVYQLVTPPLAVFIPGLPENMEIEYSEGAALYRLHRQHERDPRVIAEAKQRFREFHQGKLFCEVCGFDFYIVYGDRGKDFAEGHHVKPVSAMQPGEVTRASDICIVCSNCHSMLHRPPLMHPDQMKAIVKQQKMC